MSNSSFEAFLTNYPGPYSCQPGRDGVDRTFDVCCQTTLGFIYATYYWDAEVEAKRGALAVMLALEFASQGFRFADSEVVMMATPPEVKEFFADHPAPYWCEFHECEFDPGFLLHSSVKDNPAAYVRSGYQEADEAKMIAEAIAYSLGLLSTAL